MGDGVKVVSSQGSNHAVGSLPLRPKIVAVLAPKGGVGKTTVTMGLLVSARRAGMTAVGVGMDAQRSLEAWGAARQKQRARSGGNAYPDVPVTSVVLSDWRRLNSLSGTGLAVLDTAPGHVDDITSIEGIARLADIILIPTSPSLPDVFQVKSFYRRLASPRAFFVLNKVRRTRSYMTARNMLMGSGQLCSVDIPERDAVGVEYGRGLVLADRGLPGSEFFDGLWNFVAGQLGLPKLEVDAGEDGHAA